MRDIDKQRRPPGCRGAHLAPVRLADRALSYMWGNPQKRCRLYTPLGYIDITSSLDSALRRLRHAEFPVVLWADAACINQEDDKEKSRCVGLMSRIYRSAVDVVADQGEKDDKSRNALAVLRKIKTQIKARPKTRRGRGQPSARRNGDNGDGHGDDDDGDDGHDTKHDSHDLNLSVSDWMAVGMLFSRPWFERVWIIQEFIAAPKILFLCG
ncbi:heterokaryon incompatibility [Lasiosphaeris hirsuta]|uniref:Heterokaryon incompatibility n=1 Tax=Lasiosphaeris hirsuta TaxID=260670 RepID=A0AA40AYZ6_9PEZI|nr:heterokaryon incompatibility [Lasiosphaeris hirsuta]